MHLLACRVESIALPGHTPSSTSRQTRPDSEHWAGIHERLRFGTASIQNRYASRDALTNSPVTSTVIAKNATRKNAPVWYNNGNGEIGDGTGCPVTDAGATTAMQTGSINEQNTAEK